MSEEEILKGPVFSPPVYRQRYDAVRKFINQFGSKRVLDIGCSEGKLLTNIKFHCSSVEVIVGIDIDKEVLLENRFRTKPLMTEYLHKREIPLRMALYQGSVATPDINFANFDFISCIEVVEHLHKEELDAFPAAIFGVFRPEVVAISTPNADFNVLFPNMIGFRHPDHKFEWTRDEFKKWCTSCSEKYGYTFELSFIGFGPEGTEHLGGCSQMAVFKKTSNIELCGSLLENIVHGDYELVVENNFPHQSPKTLEEKLEDEIRYLVNRYSSMVFAVDEEKETPYREVPLAYVVNAPRMACICNNSKIIRSAVAKMFTLNEDQNSIVLPFIEEDNDDNGIDSSTEDELFEGGLMADMKTIDCGIPGLGKSKSWEPFSTDECEELWG